MFIKRIVIQGFKSYKNETIIDNFSPNLNVVVGRNGSGKSNFFAAIRFVLSDAYTNMTRQERQSLIHEGSGTVMSAYVEIVFDNRDHRFPIEKDEITIRRTIGMKKDDYSLNTKSARKSEIMNLLESAGFSRSNPYYIVPQGRVTAITNSKDSERLELLKDVAGAKVFEKKMKDSVKEMNSANKKQEQIDEMLRYINNRLSDLSIEKESLKTFEKYNNQKKVLEFNLYDREIKNISQQIEQIDSDYSEILQESNSVVKDLEEREDSVKQNEQKNSDLKNQQKLAEIDRSELDRDIEELLSKIGEVKANIRRLKLDEASASGTNELRLEKYRQQLSEKKIEMESLEPHLNELRDNENQSRLKLESMVQQQRSLLSKRGRRHQFKSKEQRDRWLKSEIERINKSIAQRNSDLQALKEDSNKINSQIESKKIQREKLQKDDQLDENVNSLETKLSGLKSQCSKLIDERKQLWRDESKLNSLLGTYHEDKSKLQEELNGMMDSSISKGLDAVHRITEKLGLEGVYGSLGELIDVSDKYKTAVEVAGGNALFYVVVDNDQTASVIMQQLVTERAGRVTFIPLNRLQVRDITYPGGNDSVPLMKKIAYDDYLKPAVQQIFGTTIVAINLERGAKLSNSYHLNAVTLDGDRCNNNGVLSGGFREQTTSRVDCLKSINSWNFKIDESESKLSDIKKNVQVKDSQITKINEDINQQKKELDAIVNKRDQREEELASIDIELDSISEELDSYKTRISKINNAVILMGNQVKEYGEELNSEFKRTLLSEDEESLLKDLQASIPSLEAEHKSVLNDLNKTELDYSFLASEVKEKLQPLVDKLSKTISKSVKKSKYSSKIDQCERILDEYESKHKTLTAERSKKQDIINGLTSEIEQCEKSLTDANEEQKAVIRKLGEFSKASEKLLSKKMSVKDRRDSLNRKINNLGLLPDSAFTGLENMSSDDILSELQEVNDNLKSYSHVNKKALEQYINFSKQRDSLVGRRKELDQAKSSIEELMLVLQERKNDAIIHTFKEVSANFTKVFEQLVPQGTGSLILQKRVDEPPIESLTQQIPQEDASDSERSRREAEYIGVSIAVSFHSKQNEQLRIEQLSGGQKSLCALTLVLAIQSCDPAPFYLFDEIDANLDTQYRASVAAMIHKLSRNAQFICTTFRKQMLEVSDKFYGVLFDNKVSSVSEITKNDAMEFVDDLQDTATGSINLM